MTNKEAIDVLTLVNRQARNQPHEFYAALDLAIKALEERPQGEWIITGKEQGAVGMIYTIRKCSKCGWEHSLVIPNNYCPRCGSKMLKVLL